MSDEENVQGEEPVEDVKAAVEVQEELTPAQKAARTRAANKAAREAEEGETPEDSSEHESEPEPEAEPAPEAPKRHIPAPNTGAGHVVVV